MEKGSKKKSKVHDFIRHTHTHTHTNNTINEKKLLRLRATDDKSENFISLSSHFKSIRRQMLNTAVNHFPEVSI